MPNGIVQFWQNATMPTSAPTDAQISELKQSLGVTEEVRPLANRIGYAVSESGRVFSWWPRPRYPHSAFTELKWRIQRYKHEKHGRPECANVTLKQHHGKYKAVRVHHLVAEAFADLLSPRLPHHEQMRHWDGNPLNNHYSNLIWGTRLENMADMVRHGHSRAGTTFTLADRPNMVIGEKHYRARLTADNVRHMRELHASGMGYIRLGKMFGVNEFHVRDIVKRICWKYA